jgi:uncharacterized protein (DUF2342 family)
MSSFGGDIKSSVALSMARTGGEGVGTELAREAALTSTGMIPPISRYGRHDTTSSQSTQSTTAAAGGDEPALALGRWSVALKFG